MNVSSSMLVALVFAVLAAHGAEACAGDVRLRRYARATGPEVTLADIADLNGADASALGGTVVGRLGADRAAVQISIDDVRALLSGNGANWAMLSLKGYANCTIARSASPSADFATETMPRIETSARAAVSTATSGSTATGVVLSNPVQSIGLDTPLTLRDRVLAWIEDFTGAQRATLRITFSPRDEALLATEAVTGRYEFAPRGRARLGRLALRIHRYRGEQIVASYAVTPVVAKRVIATVATATIGRGETIQADQVELRELYLDRDDQTYISDPDTLDGKIASALLRPGTIVQHRHAYVRPAVKRGDMLQIRCFVGDLVITTTASALEEGVPGDLVQVRNEHRDSRRTYTVRLTGPRRGVLVHDDVAASTPAAPPTHDSTKTYSHMP